MEDDIFCVIGNPGTYPRKALPDGPIGTLYELSILRDVRQGLQHLLNDRADDLSQ
jgi:hypothetical protein